MLIYIVNSTTTTEWYWYAAKPLPRVTIKKSILVNFYEWYRAAQQQKLDMV